MWILPQSQYSSSPSLLWRTFLLFLPFPSVQTSFLTFLSFCLSPLNIIPPPPNPYPIFHSTLYSNQTHLYRFSWKSNITLSLYQALFLQCPHPLVFFIHLFLHLFFSDHICKLDCWKQHTLNIQAGGWSGGQWQLVEFSPRRAMTMVTRDKGCQIIKMFNLINHKAPVN